MAHTGDLEHTNVKQEALQTIWSGCVTAELLLSTVKRECSLRQQYHGYFRHISMLQSLALTTGT